MFNNCRIRTINILELGRVVGIRTCQAYGPHVFVRGERSKTIYMALPCNIAGEDPDEKPDWLEVGNRVVVEHITDDVAGYRISEWQGEDSKHPIPFDMRQIACLLGPCFIA